MHWIFLNEYSFFRESSIFSGSEDEEDKEVKKILKSFKAKNNK